MVQMFSLGHTFRDPLHGYIAVSAAERMLIDSPILQRMRRIRQLGTSYLLFHGAEHTRFGHSLGVLEMATRVLLAIRRKEPDIFGSDEDFGRIVQLARLAGLLHDIGHSPFSHASEEVFPKKPNGVPYKHEEYSEALILNSELATMIDENFQDFGITSGDVVNVFRDPTEHGRAGILLKAIVAGELDADRMDYLLRDSLYCGVSYGNYDSTRLLDTITAVDVDGVLNLAVDFGGLHALEGFLLARYQMFVQVYLAPVRRFYDLALNRFLKSILPEECYPAPDDLDSYLAWDDQRVLEAARARAGNDQWADAIWNRHHWPLIGQASPEAGDDWFRWGVATTRLEAEFGDAVLVDPARARTQLAGPRPYVIGDTELAERPQILVLDSTGQRKRVEQLSPVVRAISSQNLLIMRLYARLDRRIEIEQRFHRELGGGP